MKRVRFTALLVTIVLLLLGIGVGIESIHGSYFHFGNGFKVYTFGITGGVAAYVTDVTKVYFMVRDPQPVNQGKTYLISYEKLVFGQNNQAFEGSDSGVWEYTIVHSTTYSNNTIPYYFNQ